MRSPVYSPTKSATFATVATRRAYDTQLTALLLAGADQNSALYHKVMRAKQAVVGPSRRNAKAGVLALNRPIAK